MKMKRRDFLKSCGIMLGGLGAAPAIAQNLLLKPVVAKTMDKAGYKALSTGYTYGTGTVENNVILVKQPFKPNKAQEKVIEQSDLRAGPADEPSISIIQDSYRDLNDFEIHDVIRGYDLKSGLNFQDGEWRGSMCWDFKPSEVLGHGTYIRVADCRGFRFVRLSVPGIGVSDDIMDLGPKEDPCCDSPGKDHCEQCQETGLANPLNH